MIEKDLPHGAWMVKVVLVRQAGQPLLADLNLAKLVDVLKGYRPVLYVNPNTYAVELFVGSKPRRDLRELAVQLVNDGLRRTGLPLWSIDEVKITQVEDDPCPDLDVDPEAP